MTGKKKRSAKRPEGSVYPRGRKWAYIFQGPQHPLTGVREHITKSGYETEDEAWEGMAEARAALATETYVKPSRATIDDFFERYFRTYESRLGRRRPPTTRRWRGRT